MFRKTLNRFPSAKLQLFAEVLAELLENRHKALVFSQFVDHLEITHNYLDEQSIDSQYLDCSTPTNIGRNGWISFKHGDIFLISLKAEGTDINLTAANCGDSYRPMVESSSGRPSLKPRPSYWTTASSDYLSFVDIAISKSFVVSIFLLLATLKLQQTVDAQSKSGFVG